MSDLAGKHGLVVVVANKRSISWGIAQALAAPRRAPALTYQVDGSRKRPRTCGRAREPCRRAMRLTNDQQLTDLVTTLDREFGD
jgi:enoyl-[acyl-carrier protein] reductase I